MLELAPYRRSIRASDEDREQTAGSLRDHFAAGRLEATELERRVTAAYQARTRRELAALLLDLPSDRLGRAARRFYWGQRRLLNYHAGTYVALNGSLVGIWEATGHGAFWPALVIAPTSAFLASHLGASRWLRKRLRIGPRD